MNAVYNISGEPAIMGSDEDLIPHNIDAEQALLGSLMFDSISAYTRPFPIRYARA